MSLVFADLECASFEIQADTIDIRNSFVRDSFFSIDANEITLDDSYVSDVLVTSAYQGRKNNIIRIQSSLINDVTIAMWLDLAARAIAERPFREVLHEVHLTGSMARAFDVEIIREVLHFEALIADSASLLVSPSLCERQGQEGAVSDCAPVNLPTPDIEDEWSKRLSGWTWGHLYEIAARPPCAEAQSIPNTRRIPGS